jgi:flavin-dependent dehydrogenase
LEQYDIVIVGAGIAGLATALHIGSSNARVLLIDKGGIGDPTRASPFTFPDVIAHFDLSDAVLQQYVKFTYMSPTGVSASFEFDQPAFVTLDYQKACQIMVNRIKKKRNTTVLERTGAVSLATSKPERSIQLRLEDSTTVSCSVLVDASGRDFFALRQLGINLPGLYSHSYGELVEGCRITHPEEMFIFSGNKYGNGGGWLYPIGEHTARLGFATVTRSSAYPKEIVEKNYRKALQGFYPFNEMFADARRTRPEFGTIPLEPIERLVHGRVLVVGDAAGHATPWYGEGVRPALEGGEMCGRILNEACEKGKVQTGHLRRYQRLWDARNRRMYSVVRGQSYFRSQEEWDNSIRYQASLTPEEMISEIRYYRVSGLRSILFSKDWRMRRPTDIFRNIIRGTYVKLRAF